MMLARAASRFPQSFAKLPGLPALRIAQAWHPAAFEKSAVKLKSQGPCMSYSSSNHLPKDSRIFTDYTIYKGKGALKLSPGRPQFRKLPTGNYVVEKEGAMFLEFSQATGQRTYDWNNKQVFALSVVELGALIDFSSPQRLDEACEFTHDPNKGKMNEGRVLKRMKVSSVAQGGFIFTLSVRDDIEKINVQQHVAVSRSELVVMRSLFNFMIPHLLGWSMSFDPSLMDSSMIMDEGDLAPDKVISVG